MARNTKAKDPNELFVKTATSIIARKGVAGFNARVLAAEAGYSLGSIYTYFNDINDLILQINGYTLERLYKKIDSAIDKKRGINKLQAAASTYFDFATENKNLWYSVMNFNHEVSAETAHWYQARVDAVLRLVKEALKPELKKGQELDEMANILWASLQGLWLLYKRESFKSSSKIHPKEMIKTLIEQLFS